MIQGESSLSLIDLEFQSGANVEVRHNFNWQVLEEEFAPVGISIAPGQYVYSRTRFSFNTDFSKKYALSTSYEIGDYFDGKLNTLSTSLRMAPLPHLALSVDYEYNLLQELGVQNEEKSTNLIGINARLALNPRVQLIGFYQYNSAIRRSVWNARLSWEYRPLSYVFIVFNRNDIQSINVADRFTQNQFISKITLLKQF
ncbi:MAG: hypothetical protein AAF399_30885 [Bacteroidota bacterium]